MTFHEILASSAVADLDAEYEILGELGRGGMAVVYLARDRELGREVAIKVIRAHDSGDEESILRFAREARMVARLEHPNIVTVYAVRRLPGDGLALVMQYVPGRTLKQAIQQDGALEFDRVERILSEIGGALAYAHRQGVVHRDVKPENIFLDEVNDRALLSDFGIAISPESRTGLTLTGTAIGTPAYMSPEQIDGAPLDGRSDVYSLGLVGWEMLTGRAPWAGESLYTVILKQKTEALPGLRGVRPGTPARLRFAIQRALAKKPGARFASADDFLAALKAEGLSAWWRRLRVTGLARAGVDAPVAAVAARGGERSDSTVDSSAETVRYQRLPGDAAAPPADPVWTGRLGTRSRIAAAAVLLLVGSAAVLSALGVGQPWPNPWPQLPRAEQAVVQPQRLTIASRAPAASPAPLSPAPVPATPPLVDSAALTVVSTDSAALPAAAVVDSAAADSAASTPPAPPPPPVAPASPATFARVAAGGTYTCALTSAGEGYCWGGNDRGQLGDGDTQRRAAAQRIGGGLRFRGIEAGVSHTCAVASGGQAVCWGSNDAGQLGDGSFTARAVPVRVAGENTFRALAPGMSHTCGLTSAGEVLCWGDDSRGQLGDGNTADRNAPGKVAARGSFQAVVTGWNHSCALAAGGAAFCWGQNTFGQLGDGTTADRSAPVAVRDAPAFRSLAAGSAHTCGLTGADQVFCWGKNSNGQLGDGTDTNRSRATPVRGGTSFVSVVTGSVHTCGLAAGGAAFCWGRNTYGQLGDGTTTERTAPVRVHGGYRFASLSASGAHTCGVTTDGRTYCWGYNIEGQLGDGTRSHRREPVRVANPAA